MESNKTHATGRPMWQIYTLIGVAIFCGTFTQPLLKLILSHGLESEAVTFYRLFIVALTLAPIALRKPEYRQELKHGFSSWRNFGLLFVLGVCKMLGFLLAAIGLRFTPVFVYNTINNLSPIFVIALSYLFLREKVSRHSMVGVAICICGVLVIGGSEIFKSGLGNLGGLILPTCAALSFSIYLIVSRKLRSDYSLMPLMFILFSIAAVLQFIICLVMHVQLLPIPPLPVIGLILLICYFCTLWPQSMPVWSMKFMPPSTYSLLNLCGVPLTAVEAYFMFGEVPSIPTIIGGMSIIAGLAYYIIVQQKEHTAAARELKLQQQEALRSEQSEQAAQKESS